VRWERHEPRREEERGGGGHGGRSRRVISRGSQPADASASIFSSARFRGFTCRASVGLWAAYGMAGLLASNSHLSMEAQEMIGALMGPG
jgi:hypothetical protein